MCTGRRCEGAGHLEGATHIPMNQVPQRLSEIPKEKEVVMICRSGGRSGHVQQHLLGAQGYTRVLNLTGGMQRWAEPSWYVKPRGQVSGNAVRRTLWREWHRHRKG